MPEKINILLIEDDHDDVELLEDALGDNHVSCQIEVLNQGDLVLPRLKQDKPLPDIIVMDLNLPKLHGREVLCLVKEHERFKKVPLMVLTTSSLDVDKKYCYDKGADKFITKPTTAEGFKQLVGEIISLARK